MTKNVNITITGLHAAMGNPGLSTESDEFSNPDSAAKDNIEVIIPGQYYYRNNNHFICYEEVSEETKSIIKSTIKFNDTSVESMKRGPGSFHMVFNKGLRTSTYYSTPMGNINLGVTTNDIIYNTFDTEKQFDFEVDYMLDYCNEKISDCHIHVKITPANELNV